MKHDITILALSRKWGGRCVAGYDHNDERIVRLVSDRLGGKLTVQFTEGINLLDKVKVETICSCPNEHQTENVLIDLNCDIKISGKPSAIEDFGSLVQEDENIFGNSYCKINDASQLDHSFELVKFKNMSIYVEDGKAKADFYVGRTLHRWYRITDMVHEREPATIRSGYAVITLPPSDDFTKQKGYYKYIAAIYETCV